MIHTHDANCLGCKHYIKDQRCKAFPIEIPNDLWVGKNLHREPVKGDNGFQYESSMLYIPPFDD